MLLHIRSWRGLNPAMRAVTVFGVVATAVTGVTYAALNSQATLTNNIISSATANLQVKSGGSFAAQDAGFAFTGVIPGGPAVPAAGKAFQLRNAGDTDLDVSVSVPAAPTFSGGPVITSKVKLVLACATTGGKNFSKTTDIDSLVAAHATGGILMTTDFLPKTTDNTANCTVKVQMDADAFSGSSTGVSDFFNIVFTGTPHTAL